jgi:Flp pilus assembly protein TadG
MQKPRMWRGGASGSFVPGRRTDRPGWRQRQAAGQGLVEFALILPILLLVVFGLIDVGRLVFANSVVSQAAREGARVAAVQASWLASTDASCQSGTNLNLYAHVCPANDAALKANVLAAARGELIGFGAPSGVYLECDTAASAPTTATWTGTGCLSNPHTTGSVVSVRVVLPFNSIIPFVGSIFPASLSGSATMVIN